MSVDHEEEQFHILYEIAKQLRLANHIKLLELTGAFAYVDSGRPTPRDIADLWIDCEVLA